MGISQKAKDDKRRQWKLDDPAGYDRQE